MSTKRLRSGVHKVSTQDFADDEEQPSSFFTAKQAKRLEKYFDIGKQLASFPPSAYRISTCDCRNATFVQLFALLATREEQPAAWPIVESARWTTGGEESSFIVFDQRLVKVRKRAVQIVQQTYVERVYARFSPDRTTTRMELCQKKPIHFQTESYFLDRTRRLAEIAREYVDFVENCDDSLEDLVYSTQSLPVGLLLDPVSLVENEMGRVFHVPLASAWTSAKGFVPAVGAENLPPRRRMRHAILFSLCRLVYMFTFGRSIDDQFVDNAPSTNFEVWCETVKADKFPTQTVLGTLTPVTLIDWLLRCMTNSIATRDIVTHPYFTTPISAMMASAIPNSLIRTSVLYKKFHEIWQPVYRESDDLIVCVVSKDTLSFLPGWDEIARNPEKMYSAEKGAFVISLQIMVLIPEKFKLVGRGATYNGVQLEFIYKELPAHGVAVSRDIVMQAFEGAKEFKIFKYMADGDVLDFDTAFSKGTRWSAFEPSVQDLFLGLLFWCVTHQTRVPYMLSPSILTWLFDLPCKKATNLNTYRALNPSFSNQLLDKFRLGQADIDCMSGLGASDAASLGSCVPSTSLELLADYAAPVFEGSQRSSILPLAHFQAMVAAVYTEPEDLVFLFCMREYETSKKNVMQITPAIAIASVPVPNHPCLTLGRILPVVSIEAVFAPSDRLLLYYLVHYQRIIEAAESKADEVREAYLVIEMAKNKTFVYFLRWLSKATKETLATFWNYIFGMPTIVAIQAAKVGGFVLPEEFDMWTAEACSPRTVNESRIEGLSRGLAARINLFNFMSTKTPVQAPKFNLSFRSPLDETKFLLSPQFASCSSTIYLSICHENYESFADSMDAAMLPGKSRFTMNT